MPISASRDRSATTPANPAGSSTQTCARSTGGFLGFSDGFEVMKEWVRGQTVDERSPVGAGEQPHVHDRQHPLVLAAADQTSESLLQVDDGGGNLILTE